MKVMLFKILPKGFFSRIFGYISLIPFPAFILQRIIKWYVKTYGVLIDEAVVPDGGFKTLNMFFTRKLKEGVLTVKGSDDDIVATTDSRVDQFGTISGDTLLQAKGVEYSLGELIPSKMAERFINGKFVTLYLSPGDYHRIHTPVSGRITGFFNIPGKLYTVQEWLVKKLRGLFAINERLITYIDTGRGMTAVCKIGALNVGKISLSYDNSVTNKFFRRRKEFFYEEGKMPQVSRGDEIAVFNLGSTVIILFEEGMAEISGIEEGQMVRVGDVIGKIVKK